MTADNAGGRTARGEASNRVLHALAAEFPIMHTENSILNSASLRKAHGKDVHVDLTPNEKAAARKRLNALMNEGAVRASLWLNGKDDRVRLDGAGLVAITVDIATLREEEWLRLGQTLPAQQSGRYLMLAPDKPAT